MTRVLELSRQRACLAARSDAERDDIARGLAAIAHRLAWLERGGSAAAWVVARPWTLGLGVAALVALGPAALVRWAGRGLDVALLLLRLRSAL